jgi:hypothetical protein
MKATAYWRDVITFCLVALAVAPAASAESIYQGGAGAAQAMSTTPPMLVKSITSNTNSTVTLRFKTPYQSPALPWPDVYR